jgi:hypothetical protein
MTTPYHKIKRVISEVLTNYHFHQDIKDTMIDSDGSTYCIYTKDDTRLMIEWDSEEEMSSILILGK